MTRYLFSVLFLFSFVLNSNASTVSYSDGEGYSGEILFQNIGAFYVDNGVLNLDGIDIPDGTKTLIPFTEKSFTYLGDFDFSKDILLPTSKVSAKDYALYNLEVESLRNGYEIFFQNSDTSARDNQFLIIPYLKKGDLSYMIIRNKDNFVISSFSLPANPKTVIQHTFTSTVPNIVTHFNLNIRNEYTLLEKPVITYTDNGITITDDVSGYFEEFVILRDLFPKYYQNVIYVLNLDDNRIYQDLTGISHNTEVLNVFFDTINVNVSSNLVLTDLSSKVDEQETLKLSVEKSVAETKDGGKGTLYYGMWLTFVFCIIAILWYFDDHIKQFLFKTGRFKHDLVRSSVKKQYLGVLRHLSDDSFVDSILKLQILPSNKLYNYSIEEILDQLKNISNRISKNDKLKEELLLKQRLFADKLEEARELVKNSTVEVRFSAVSFSKNILALEKALSLLSEKLIKIDQLNEKYIERFKHFCVYLSKYILDVEMDQISDSIDIAELLEDEADKSSFYDLFNLERLDEYLVDLKDYDEALKDVISKVDQNKVSKIQ